METTSAGCGCTRLAFRPGMRRATRTASWISGHRRDHLTVVAYIGPLPFEELLPACMVVFAVVIPALRAGWTSRRSGTREAEATAAAIDLLKRARFDPLPNVFHRG